MMYVLKGKLYKYQFRFLLEMKYSKNFAKMIAQTKKYTNIEEAYELFYTSLKVWAKKKNQKDKT